MRALFLLPLSGAVICLSMGFTACTPTNSTRIDQLPPTPVASSAVEKNSATTATVNFDTQLAPLIEKSCGTCHGVGETEPDLSDEEGVKANLDDVLANVKAKHKKVAWTAANIKLLTTYVAEKKAAAKKPTKAGSTTTAKSTTKKSSEPTPDPELPDEELPVETTSPAPAPKPTASAPPTFALQVKPMLDKTCNSCHVNAIGAIQPFTTLAGAKAAPVPVFSTGHKTGVWTPAEQAIISAWIAAGKP